MLSDQNTSDSKEPLANPSKMLNNKDSYGSQSVKKKNVQFDYEALPSISELIGEKGQYINTLERRLRADTQSAESTKFP